MRCRLVACLWHDGDGPHIHQHKITAHAVLDEPPTLYTGASDGSIVWWNIDHSHAQQPSSPLSTTTTATTDQRIWAMAMLCGHAAAIVGLEICTPIARRGQIQSSRGLNSIPARSTALMSACADGVLCVWSRGSGHCRLRRKLPPWVGTPSLLSSLPSSTQYICVACNFADAVHHSAETAEMRNDGHLQSDITSDKEMHPKRTSECAIVIVDSCTLNIVRTIAHGSFSVGPLKFMAVVPSCEDSRGQSVVVADMLGKMQLVAIPESDPNGEPTSVLQRSSSHLGPLTEYENLQIDELQGLQAASISANGSLLALVFRTQCIFKSMTNMTTIGGIDLTGSSLCDGGLLTQACPTGGMFLHGACSMDPGGGPVEQFAVWSNSGAAIVYKIFVSAAAFDFELLYEIPVAPGLDCMKMSVRFCQLNYYILRLESLCIEMHASTSWQPRIWMWSVSQSPMVQKSSIGTSGTMKSTDSNDSYSCIVAGEGSFFADGIRRANLLSEAEASNSSAPHYGFLTSGRIISSSLVLSGDHYVPHAVIYGFYNGDIEVVSFEKFRHEVDLVDEGTHRSIGLQKSKQLFVGHRGAVLCLAAHHMAATLSELNFKQVLISGSSDCMIRIWDLVTGRLLCVMHHHVGRVKQIILPPPGTCRPWSDCFLSVAEDCCVALASLETLKVERMFPGHPSYPLVVWDSTRGYIACLCRGMSTSSDPTNALYLWDVKTGACERILHGSASHSMFDHFCKGINVNSITGNTFGGITSASSLLLPENEDTSLTESHTYLEKGTAKSSPPGDTQRRTFGVHGSDICAPYDNKGKISISRTTHEFNSHAADHSFMGKTPSHAINHRNHLIKCSCPYPGIATLKFDLLSLMHSHSRDEKFTHNDGKLENAPTLDRQLDKVDFCQKNLDGGCYLEGSESHPTDECAWVRSPEGLLLRFSISFLHLWDVDQELDKLLADEMNICKPQSFVVTSGLEGDRGSLTLAFPSMRATLEFWRSSSEFCAMRSLAMVSLAQGITRLSRSSSAGSSTMAAFYTRNFAEKVPDIKPPLLQLLVSFWQYPSEHIRMAARSLFHCAASRSIPLPLSGPNLALHVIHLNYINGDIYKNMGDVSPDNSLCSNQACEAQTGDDERSVLEWMESFEMQDWVSCIGGTGQDAMASHIIVAAALVVWYPSLVKPNLAKLVVHPLIKLVMAMSDKYSSTAVELLAEGMESTWKACLGPEIPQLITDIFFQIECVSGAPANKSTQKSSIAITMRESLVGILLPSLAMADISGFLNVIERQIWATASDSPVHLVSLMTLIRVIRGSPKPLSLHLDKVVNFILQTMDHGNSVMRKTCLQSSMAALREVVRVFPMVVLNGASTRLAVGDVIGDIKNANIRIYDMQSLTKIKVLDASGPPGLPNLLGGASDTMITTVISALSFSPDGEGLVAFSEHGLMIRWWSLGTGWWEKLSRNIVLVQCTKLILVPPWEGFSPNSSRSSIMASIISNDSPAVLPGQTGAFGDTDHSKLSIHNVDLSYRLQWVSERKVVLVKHGQELGSFQF